MQVDVFDPPGGLAGQPGGEEVLDVGYPGVQQVEALDDHPQVVAELVAGLRVDNGRLTGLDAVVFEERTWTEVANSKAAERPSWRGFWWSKRGASRQDPVQRAGDVLFSGRHVDESGSREGEVQVGDHPGMRLEVVGDLDAYPPGRRTVLRTARVAYVDQFGVEAEIPARGRGLELGHRNGSDADLGALGPGECR